MSNTKTRPARAPRYAGEVTELKAFLSAIECEATPTIHVNGSAYASALVAIDFGSPLDPFRLSQDDNAVLTERLRRLARSIVGRENANVRISHDGANGIFWASLA